MRSIKIFNILIASILLVACNAQPTVTPTFTPTYTHSPTATATRTPTVTFTPTPKPSHTPKPTKTPLAPTATPESITLILPTGEPLTQWQGIPVMPGAIAGDVLDDGGEESYSFTIQSSVAEVQQYYTTNLPDTGWAVLAVGEGQNGNVMAIFTKGSDILSIAILLADEDAGIVLVMFVLS